MKTYTYLSSLEVNQDPYYRRINVSGFFKAIGQAVLTGAATSNPIAGAVKGGNEVMKNTNSTISKAHRAFELILNGIGAACEELLKEQQLNCTQNEALLLAKRMGKEFQDIEIQITATFFDAPQELTALQDLVPVFQYWLEGLTLSKSEAERIAQQLPKVFFRTVALEWGKRQAYYEPILKAFDNPFTKAWEERYCLEAYYEELKARVKEPCLKDAKLTLKDLYIKPSFLVNSKSTAYYDKDEFVTPIEYQGNLHDYLLARLVQEQFPLDLSPKQRLIFLLGQPGQGKSSLCTYLSYQLLHQTDFTKKLYVVRLRDIEDNVQLISEPFKVLKRYFKEEYQLKVRWKEPMVLILDGLDELYMSNGLTNQDLKQFYKALERKISSHKTLTILLTSRHHYLNIEQEVEQRRTTILKLAPFSLEQQQQWLAIYKKQHPKIRLTAHQLEQIQEDYQLEPIRELIEQPILLHLIAKADLDLEQPQLMNRATIYQQLFDRIMNRDWAEEQLDKYTRLQTSTEVQQRFRAWLQEIAFTIYNSDQEYITITELLNLPATIAFHQDKCIETTEGLEDAAKDLLVAFYFKKSKQKKTERLRGNQAIEFLHKSLQEYLAVEYMWRTILALVENNPSDEEVLKKFSDLFAQKALNGNMQHMMHAIVRKAETAIRRLVRQRLKEALPFCLEHQFLYAYSTAESGKRTPLSHIEACFKNFWLVLAHLVEADETNIDLLEGEMRDKMATLLSTFDGVRMNLSGADLRGVDLIGADLRGAHLIGADLMEADLRGAELRRADLRGAELRGAELIGADLIGAELIGADLMEAHLSGADLSEANLIGANLIGANLTEANLSEAYLSGAYLSGAKIAALNFFQELKQLNCVGVEELIEEYYVEPIKQYEPWDDEQQQPYYLIKKRPNPPQP